MFLYTENVQGIRRCLLTGIRKAMPTKAGSASVGIRGVVVPRRARWRGLGGEQEPGGEMRVTHAVCGFPSERGAGRGWRRRRAEMSVGTAGQAGGDLGLDL